MALQKLGRREPADWKHVEKYPLTTKMAMDLPKPVPVLVGVNWYESFDNPVRDKDGKWWVGRGNLGAWRGGHCVVMPQNNSDTYGWYDFYNQGEEGACVGFGASRMMSLLNRKRYVARWAWNRAKEIDIWPETNPGDNEGTSVRAVLDVLRNQGHIIHNTTIIRPEEGIIANKWAYDVQDVHIALGNPDYNKLGAIPFHNSWGRNYPKKVWMPSETWNILLHQNGEFGIPVDKV